MAKDEKTDDELKELFQKQLPPVQLPAETEAKVQAAVKEELAKQNNNASSGTGNGDSAKS